MLCQCPGWRRWFDDFGRAISRILSAQPFLKLSNFYSHMGLPCPLTFAVQQSKERLGRESFVSAADTRNLFRRGGTRSGPLLGFLFGLAPDGVCRASALALGAVRSYRTFSPLPSPSRNCQTSKVTSGRLCSRTFTIRQLKEGLGGLSFCGTVRRKVSRLFSRVYLEVRLLTSAATGYAASRPLVFGLSSPSLRQGRFSALPKSQLL